MRTDFSYVKELEQQFMYPAAMVKDWPDLLEKEKGIYAFVEKNWPNFFVYVGSATGKDGISRRVLKEHLNPAYLEARAEKHIAGKDDFQITAGNHLSVRGKRAIDKSRFRCNLAREHRLKAGEATVNFILEHYHLQYLLLPGHLNEEIKEIEKAIIQETRPRYNILFVE